jgi:tetratricopeptide (TPR) repeat protein
MSAPLFLDDAALSREIARRLPPARAAEVAARLRRERTLWAAAHHAPTLAAWLALAANARSLGGTWWRPAYAGLAAVTALLDLGDPRAALAWLQGEGRAVPAAALHRLAPDAYPAPGDLPERAVRGGLFVDGDFAHALACDVCAAASTGTAPALHALLVALPPVRRGALLMHAVELFGPGLLPPLLDPSSPLALPGTLCVALITHSADPGVLLAQMPVAALDELAHALAAAGEDERAALVARAALARPPVSGSHGSTVQHTAYAAGLGGARGRLHLLAGAPSAAAALLDESGQAATRLLAALATARGQALQAAGDLAGALGAFEQACAHDPQCDEARVLRAGALNALGRPAEALAALEGQAPSPVAPSAHWQRALALARQAPLSGGQAPSPVLAPSPVVQAVEAFEQALRQCAAGATLFAARPGELIRFAQELPPAQVTDALCAAASAASAAHPAALELLALAAELHARARAWRAAHAHWTALAVLRPQAPSVHLALGRCALEAGDHDGAARALEQAVSLAPDDPEMQLACGEAALRRDDLTRARVAADKALALAPRDPAAHTLLGRVLAASGDLDKAAAALVQGTSLNPSHAPAWRALAGVHRRAGRYTRALALFESALQHVPGDPELHAGLGALLHELDRPTEAFAAYEQAEAFAAERDPRNPARAAWALARAELIATLGFPERARATLAAATGLPGAGGQIYQALAVAHLEAGDREAAGAAAQHALSAFQHDGIDADLILPCDVLVRTGQAAVAVQALRQAVTRSPAAASLHLALGRAHESLAQWDQALDAYRSVGRLAPNDPVVQHRIGVACAALGRTDAALVALREAALADPTNADILGDMAQVLMAAGFPAEAADVWCEVVERRPDDGRALMQLGVAQHRDARHAAALATLRRARELEPDDPEVLGALARAAHAAGERDEAVAAYAGLSEHAGAALLHEAGRALLALDEPEAAVHKLASAATAAPDHAAIRAAHGAALTAIGRPRLALPELEAACLLTPADPARNCALAELHWTLGDAPRALALWQHSAALATKDPAIRLRLGRAYMDLGRPVEALTWYEAQIAMHSGQPPAHHAAGRAALAAGSLDRAAGHLQRAAEMDPDNAELQYELGHARLACGDRDGAYQACRRAAERLPEIGRYQLELARVLCARGQDEEAVIIMDHVVRTNGHPAEIHEELGHVALRAGQYARAAHALRATLAMRPDHAPTRHAYAAALLGWAEVVARRVRAGLPEPSGAADPAPAPGAIEEALATLRRLQVEDAPVQPAALQRDLGRALALRGWKSTRTGDLRAAEQALADSLADADGRNVTVTQRTLGLIRLRAGRTVEGLAALEAAAGLDPQDAVTFLEIGLAYFEVRRFDRAIAALGHATTLAPRDAVPHYHLAVALRAAGRHAEANSALGRALELEPGVAAWHADLAHGLGRTGQAEAALTHWRHAVELDGGVAEYYAQLGLALAEQGQAHEAGLALEAAIHILPDQALWWRQLAHAYQAQELAARAAQCCERAHGLDPQDAHTLVLWAAVLRALHEPDQALQRLQDALAVEPDMPAALALLGGLHRDAGRVADAQAGLRRAADCAQGTERAAYCLELARLYEQQGRPECAPALLEEALQADPGLAEAHARLGDWRLAAHDAVHARESYEQALALEPDNPAHYTRLGCLCRVNGQLDQALAHLQRARELDPDYAPAYHEMGRVYEDRRQSDLALEVYRLATLHLPDDPEAYRLAGYVYKARKAYVEAFNMFRKAAELAPHDVDLHRQIATVGALAFVQGQAALAA